MPGFDDLMQWEAQAASQIDMTAEDALERMVAVQSIIKEFNGTHDALFAYIREQMAQAKAAIVEFANLSLAELLQGDKDGGGRCVSMRVVEIHTRINDYRRVVDYVRGVMGIAADMVPETAPMNLEDEVVDDGGGGGDRLGGHGEEIRRSQKRRKSKPRQSDRLRRRRF